MELTGLKTSVQPLKLYADPFFSLCSAWRYARRCYCQYRTIQVTHLEHIVPVSRVAHRVVVLETFVGKVDDGACPVRIPNVDRDEQLVEAENVQLHTFRPALKVGLVVALFGELLVKVRVHSEDLYVVALCAAVDELHVEADNVVVEPSEGAQAAERPGVDLCTAGKGFKVRIAKTVIMLRSVTETTLDSQFPSAPLKGLSESSPRAASLGASPSLRPPSGSTQGGSSLC